MEIRDIFKNLGLTDKEITVYLALIELGEASVAKIAGKATIKRPTCYVVLSELEKKGYVSRVPKQKAILFVAQHPRKLLTEAELQVKELQIIVPQLESLFQKGGDKPRVAIYEGKEKLDSAYDESFIVKGEVLYMSTLKLSQAVFERTFRKMDSVKLSKDYRMRELVDESEEGLAYIKKNQSEFRQIRMIPEELLPFEVDIGIFANKVLITSLKKEFFTVSIQSNEINQAFRALFEGFWRIAKSADN